jgi:hypothetical protein
MFAYRTTWIIPGPKMREAHDLLVAECQRVLATHPIGIYVRVYTPDISPNVLVFETTVESEEVHEKFWADYNASPEGQAFWAQWMAVAERRLGNERWIVEEFR